MNTKTIYQCDSDGWYLGEVEADEDPLEPGRYLIPAHAVETAPPARPWPDGKAPRWVGSEWMLQSPPVNSKPSPVADDPPTPEQIMSRLVARVQRWLDEQARALGYDDVKSAVTYADEPAVPKFQQEGAGDAPTALAGVGALLRNPERGAGRAALHPDRGRTDR